MAVGSRTYRLLIWNVRAGFRLLCWLATSVGQVMVALAAAFKACQRASASFGQFVIPAQIALLLIWAPTRLLFLALAGAAKSAHRTDMHLRNRWATAGAGAQLNG